MSARTGAKLAAAILGLASLGAIGGHFEPTRPLPDLLDFDAPVSLELERVGKKLRCGAAFNARLDRESVSVSVPGAFGPLLEKYWQHQLDKGWEANITVRDCGAQGARYGVRVVHPGWGRAAIRLRGDATAIPCHGDGSRCYRLAPPDSAPAYRQMRFEAAGELRVSGKTVRMSAAGLLSRAEARRLQVPDDAFFDGGTLAAAIGALVPPHTDRDGDGIADAWAFEMSGSGAYESRDEARALSSR